MSRHWQHRRGGAGYSSPRQGSDGGALAPFLVLLICLCAVFLLTHPTIFSGLGVSIPPSTQQPSQTQTPSAYEEIRARFGNRYNGYENLIKRTPSGGFDTRDADAAMAGQQRIPPTTRPVTQVVTTPAPVSSGGIASGVEVYILQFTNEERQANGVSILTMSSCLNQVARAHSEDMAMNNYFSHINLHSQDPSARAGANHCPTQKPLGGGIIQIGIAENIGKMPTGNVVGHGYVAETPSSMARAQVDSWMSSSGHRANILNPTYSYIGIGTAEDSSGYYISTQDFW